MSGVTVGQSGRGESILLRTRLIVRSGRYPAWVYSHSKGFEAALRLLVRDERADRRTRIWAISVLRSWRVALDPAIYPFAAEWTRRPARKARAGA